MRTLYFSALFLAPFLFRSQTVCDSTTMAQEGTYHLVKLTAVETTTQAKDMLSLSGLCHVEQLRNLTDTTEAIIESYKVVIYPAQQRKKK